MRIHFNAPRLIALTSSGGQASTCTEMISWLFLVLNLAVMAQGIVTSQNSTMWAIKAQIDTTNSWTSGDPCNWNGITCINGSVTSFTCTSCPVPLPI
jgi:hypothetical protein